MDVKKGSERESRYFQKQNNEKNQQTNAEIFGKRIKEFKKTVS